MIRLLRHIGSLVVCPVAAWVTAGAAGLTAANSLGLFGSKSQDQASGAAAASGRYYDQLAQLGQDEWNQWTSGGLPLLQSLAKQAGEDRTAQETALAAGATKDAFANSRAMARRALNLGEGGDQSDRAAAILAPSYMDEAGKVSQAITDARRSEQARQFGQTTQAVNIYRGFPGQATSAIGAAAGGESSLAGQYRGLAQLENEQMAQGIYGGAVLGNAAAKWYGGGGAPNPNANYNADGTIASPSSYGNTYSLSDPAYGADGGVLTRRGFKRNYAGGGVIKGPGSGTSDSIPAKAKPGTFILSADTVSAIGHKKVREIIEKSGVRPGEGATGYSGVPIRVSNGEAEIPPETVRYHGVEFFNKLQQKYHRPVVDDDGGDGRANGGVIKKRLLPKSVEDAIFRSMPQQAIGGRR